MSALAEEHSSSPLEKGLEKLGISRNLLEGANNIVRAVESNELVAANAFNSSDLKSAPTEGFFRTFWYW